MIKELYRVEDEYGMIIVLEQGDQRILSFASELQQSSVTLHKPYLLVHEYTQIMLLSLVFNDVKNITILGLGGGGLAHCLHYYFPQIRTHVVELRQAVIDVAYQWFNLPDKANLKVICADAKRYVEKVKPKTIDLLLSDLYEADGMSEVQAQLEFIVDSFNALSDTGWLVINFHDQPEKDSELMTYIFSLFSHVYVCDVFIGNWVVFCGKDILYDNGEMNERVRSLSKKVDMPLSYYFKQLKEISDEV